jgi:ABC-type molybdate transport system substrate-binding protein
VATLYPEKLDTISVGKEHIDAVTSATYGTSDLRKVKVTVGVTVYAKDKKHVAQFYDFIVKESPALFAKTGMTPLEGVAFGN